jgi:hypothetical protein
MIRDMEFFLLVGPAMGGDRLRPLWRGHAGPAMNGLGQVPEMLPFSVHLGFRMGRGLTYTGYFFM